MIGIAVKHAAVVAHTPSLAQALALMGVVLVVMFVLWTLAGAAAVSLNQRLIDQAAQDVADGMLLDDESLERVYGP